MTNDYRKWSGGRCPEPDNAVIQPVYRGPPAPTGVRITCAPASRLDWSHDGEDDDIIAYKVLR